MEQYKTCTKCGQTKFLTDFNKRASSKDGYRCSCRGCDKNTRAIYKRKPRNNEIKYGFTPYALLSEAQKERKRAGSRAWNKANKAKRTLAMAKRRALQKGNGCFLVTDKEIEKIQKMACLYCGLAGGEVDHVIPLTKGGCHSIGNLAPCCRSCNSSKNNLLLMEWKIKREASHQPTSD